MENSRNFWRTLELCVVCLRRAGSLDEFVACLTTKINRKQGNILTTMGSWNDAEALFQRNAKRVRDFGLTELLAESKVDLGFLLLKKGSLKQALRLLNEAYEVFCAKHDKKGQNFALQYMGMIHEHTGDYAKAMECYDRQLNIARKINFKHDIAIATGNKGVVHYHLGEYEKSISYYKKQLELSKEMNDPLNMAIVHGNLGIVYQHQGKLKTAITYYEKSLKGSEQLGYKLGISVALANLGSMHITLGDYESALRCHQRNLRISKEMGDRHGESYALGNIGVLWMYRGEFSRALDCFKKTLTISKALSDKKSIGLALGNLGKAYAVQKEYKKAKTHFQKAIALLQETGVKYHLCHFLLHSAKTHAAMEAYEKAAAENSEAHSIAQEIKREDVIFECKILAARMLGATNREASLLALQSLLEKVKKEDERAQLHYWMFKISKQKKHRAKARALYRKLAKRTPHELYVRRLKELT